MLYSYAGFPERSFSLFERRESEDQRPLVVEDGLLPSVSDDTIKKVVEDEVIETDVEQIVTLERGSSVDKLEVRFKLAPKLSTWSHCRVSQGTLNPQLSRTWTASTTRKGADSRC